MVQERLTKELSNKDVFHLTRDSGAFDKLPRGTYVLFHKNRWISTGESEDAIERRAKELELVINECYIRGI